MKGMTKAQLSAANVNLRENLAESERVRLRLEKEVERITAEKNYFQAETQKLMALNRGVKVRLGERFRSVTDHGTSMEEMVAVVKAVNEMGWLPVAALEWPMNQGNDGATSRPVLHIYAREILS